MTLDRHRRDWEDLAAVNPFAAVLGDGRGPAWDPDAFFATGEAEVETVLATCEGLGVPERRGEALDFGCGLGRTTQALARRFGRCIGVDISGEMVARARELAADAPNVEFRVNDAPHLAVFGDGAFDLVYSSIVLQHQPSAEVALGYVGEFVRVLRPGGVAVFQIPYRLSWRARLRPRQRLYRLLRAAGTSEARLQELGLTPMRMLAVPRAAVERAVGASGGEVVLAEEDPRSAWPFPSLRYFVRRRGGAV